MQETRLNTLLNLSLERLVRWIKQPWRRTSLLLIGLLLGFFLASAISTTFGARSQWDIIISGITVVVTEAISYFYYHTRRKGLASDHPRNLFLVMLNAIKIGIIYGMVLEACKLGS